VRKLEEKERLLLNSISTMEKEAGCRQQAMELHKRKAIESAQSAADLKLHLGKAMFPISKPLPLFSYFLVILYLPSSSFCIYHLCKISSILVVLVVHR